MPTRGVRVFVVVVAAGIRSGPTASDASRTKSLRWPSPDSAVVGVVEAWDLASVDPALHNLRPEHGQEEVVDADSATSKGFRHLHFIRLKSTFSDKSIALVWPRRLEDAVAKPM